MVLDMQIVLRGFANCGFADCVLANCVAQPGSIQPRRSFD
jgi:hypothetical protein